VKSTTLSVRSIAPAAEPTQVETTDEIRTASFRMREMLAEMQETATANYDSAIVLRNLAWKLESIATGLQKLVLKIESTMPGNGDGQ